MRPANKLNNENRSTIMRLNWEKCSVRPLGALAHSIADAKWRNRIGERCSRPPNSFTFNCKNQSNANEPVIRSTHTASVLNCISADDKTFSMRYCGANCIDNNAHATHSRVDSEIARRCARFGTCDARTKRISRSQKAIDIGWADYWSIICVLQNNSRPGTARNSHRSHCIQNFALSAFVFS